MLFKISLLLTCLTIFACSNKNSDLAVGIDATKKFVMAVPSETPMPTNILFFRGDPDGDSIRTLPPRETAALTLTNANDIEGLVAALRDVVLTDVYVKPSSGTVFHLVCFQPNSPYQLYYKIVLLADETKPAHVIAAPSEALFYNSPTLRKWMSDKNLKP